MSRSHRVLLITALVLACGGDEIADPGLYTVEVQAAQDTLRALGDTVQLVAVVRDRGGDPVAIAVTWTSSDPQVIQIVDLAAVAAGPGSATVAASTVDGSTGTGELVVRQVPVRVEVVTSDSAVVELDSVSVEAAAYDANDSAIADLEFAWSVDPPALARLEDGMLIGLSRGTVEVRAEAGGISGTATVTVTDGFLVRTINASSFLGAVCAVDPAGRGYCWGESGDTARPAPGDVRFVSLTTGYVHFCGVDTAGVGWCWGRNSHGQLGLGTNSPSSINDAPVRAQEPLTFSFLRATAHDFTCGLVPDGTAYCWGHNDRGQLGRGFRSSNEFDAQTPTGVPTMTMIDGDAFHACGIGTDAATYCWGIIGVGDGSDGSDSPVTVSGGHTFVTLSTGFMFTCAVTTGDETFCWGLNTRGQLGTGDTTDAMTPQPVGSAPAFAAVTGGYEHACGLTADGAAWCWGSNGAGQLGDGTLTDRFTPVAAQPALRFSEVTAGFARTCGVTTEGAVFCWGAGDPSPRRILREQEISTAVASIQATPRSPHER